MALLCQSYALVNLYYWTGWCFLSSVTDKNISVLRFHVHLNAAPIIFFYDWLVQANPEMRLDFCSSFHHLCIMVWSSLWILSRETEELVSCHTKSYSVPVHCNQSPRKGQQRPSVTPHVGRYRQTDEKVPSPMRNSRPLPCKDKKWKPGQEGISFTGMTSVSLRSQQALGLPSQGKHDTISL